MKKIIDLLLGPYRRWKQRRAKRKLIEEMRKRDPFIY